MLKYHAGQRVDFCVELFVQMTLYDHVNPNELGFHTGRGEGTVFSVRVGDCCKRSCQY